MPAQAMPRSGIQMDMLLQKDKVPSFGDLRSLAALATTGSAAEPPRLVGSNDAILLPSTVKPENDVGGKRGIYPPNPVGQINDIGGASSMPLRIVYQQCQVGGNNSIPSPEQDKKQKPGVDLLAEAKKCTARGRPPGRKMLTQEERRERRLLSNRLAAKRAYYRRLDRTTTMSLDIHKLTDELATSRSKVAIYERVLQQLGLNPDAIAAHMCDTANSSGSSGGRGSGSGSGSDETNQLASPLSMLPGSTSASDAGGGPAVSSTVASSGSILQPSIFQQPTFASATPTAGVGNNPRQWRTG